MHAKVLRLQGLWLSADIHPWRCHVKGLTNYFSGLATLNKPGAEGALFTSACVKNCCKIDCLHTLLTRHSH